MRQERPSELSLLFPKEAICIPRKWLCCGLTPIAADVYSNCSKCSLQLRKALTTIGGVGWNGWYN